MSVAEHKALIHRIVEAANRSDWEAIERLFAPTYLDHDRSREHLPPGPTGVRQAWLATRAAFPDLRVTVADLVADGDRVAVRGVLQGTHDGELMGIPPTGRRVTVSFIDINRIAEGELAERWAESDTVGLLQQIGVIPGAGETAPDDRGAPASAAPRDDGAPEANKALVRCYADVLLNRHELDRAGAFLAPDFVGHFAGAPGPVRGIAAWREMFGGFLTAFPDYGETVHDILGEGDRVAARITFRGTHRGDFMGLPPTGKTIAAGGMTFLRIADGRVRDQWAKADLLGLLQQLGLMPAPAPSGA
jgi:steroid delta-isomerase-like uncharacterized protein